MDEKQIYLEKRASTLLEEARLIIITDDESLQRANNAKVFIKKVRREIDDFCDPNIATINKAHKVAIDQKRTFESPLIEAEGLLNPKITGYIAEIRRKQLGVILAKKREEDKKIKAAIKAEEKGDSVEAEKILEEETKTAEIPVPVIPKMEGTSIKKIWKWRVKDKTKIPRKYFILDNTLITRLVKATQGRTGIPGIETYSEDILSTRIR